MYRWERRDKKLKSKKRRMKVSGKSVFLLDKLAKDKAKQLGGN